MFITQILSIHSQSILIFNFEQSLSVKIVVVGLFASGLNLL